MITEIALGCTTVIMIALVHAWAKVHRERNAIIANMAKELNECVSNVLKVYLESGPNQPSVYVQSGERPLEEKQASREDRDTLEPGTVPEDFLSRISKGTKTAVPFGEDVSE